MNYYNPNQVRSPQRYVKDVDPLFDGGEDSVSIAILENCEKNNTIGIRWNVSENEKKDERKVERGRVCVGMPQSHGYSVWFLLPESAWRLVPQMIKGEIASGHNNLIDISEEEIQSKIDQIIE